MDPPISEPSPSAEQPRPRWWSPRRPWLPLAIALLLAAGSAAWGSAIANQTRDLEADTAEARTRSERLELDIESEDERLAKQERSVERESVIAKDCAAAARAGVAFLHQVVRSLGFLARFENTAYREAHEEVNRLIREANRATRLCTRGLG